MRVKYGILRHYPHMIGEEKDIWSRFILQHPGYFEEVEYDVRVGEGVQLTEDWTTKDKTWARHLTQKRIDVVGYKGNETVLVEVKFRVMIGTIGQVLGYKFLYEREKKIVNKTKSIVVAAYIGSDDFDVLEHYDIEIFIV